MHDAYNAVGYAEQFAIRGFKVFPDDVVKALEQHPKVFPPLYVNMVRAGEQSGVVTKALLKYAPSCASRSRRAVGSSSCGPAG